MRAPVAMQRKTPSTPRASSRYSILQRTTEARLWNRATAETVVAHGIGNQSDFRLTEAEVRHERSRQLGR